MTTTSRTGASLSAMLLIALTGCATTQSPVDRGLDERIAARIPASVLDRIGWAGDIATALHALRLPGNDENVCAILAVIEQEGGFVVDPPLPNLGKIARRELEARANAKRIPDFAVGAALQLKSSSGQRYGVWLAEIRTENQLSLLFEDSNPSNPSNPGQP